MPDSFNIYPGDIISEISTEEQIYTYTVDSDFLISLSELRPNGSRVNLLLTSTDQPISASIIHADVVKSSNYYLSDYIDDNIIDQQTLTENFQAAVGNADIIPTILTGTTQIVGINLQIDTTIPLQISFNVPLLGTSFTAQLTLEEMTGLPFIINDRYASYAQGEEPGYNVRRRRRAIGR